jgi:capsular exopolysaccharide synthesis family protein
MVASRQSADSLPSELDSGPIREYRMRLNELRRQLREAEAVMTPQHYKVRELTMQVADLEQAIERERANTVRRLQADLETTLHREKLLTSVYEKDAAEASKRDDQAVRYNMLKRDVDSGRQLYESLLQRVGEVGLAAAMRTATITVVDPATAPFAPYSPNSWLNLGLGLVTGSTLGLVVALVRTRGDRTIRAPGYANVHMQLRELGVIPSLRGPGFKGLLAPRNGSRRRTSQVLEARALSESLKSGGDPAESGTVDNSSRNVVPSPDLTAWLESPEISEAFTATMNSLLFAEPNQSGGRVIVMTSPELGDGKTTVSTNLAIALAHIGRRVVLVDGDLRRPRVHSIFNEEGEGGLASILNGTDPIRSVTEFVRETSIPNLFIIPTDPVVEGLSRKLHSPRMRSLVARLRADFDVVIIDSPPVLHISDARVLGRLSDGVLLVFRARKTTKEAALAVHDCLVQDGIRIIGTILNDWNSRKDERYGKYFNYTHVA